MEQAREVLVSFMFSLSGLDDRETCVYDSKMTLLSNGVWLCLAEQHSYRGFVFFLKRVLLLNNKVSPSVGILSIMLSDK